MVERTNDLKLLGVFERSLPKWSIRRPPDVARSDAARASVFLQDRADWPREASTLRPLFLGATHPVFPKPARSSVMYRRAGVRTEGDATVSRHQE
jgi:hypothetical protein